MIPVNPVNIDTVLEQAAALLAPWCAAPAAPEPNRRDFAIAAADLLPAVGALRGWGYLAAITGVDTGTGLEALYHFCNGAAVVTLRVAVPYENPAVPSICAEIQAASVFERELAEMFGVTVVGTPDPTRLFLPDDWPQGVYPLRKDFSVGGDL